MILEIAGYLSNRDLNHLSSASQSLYLLLSPPLLRRSSSDDLSRCITLNRPASLVSILRSPTININDSICIPDGDIRTPDDDLFNWPLHYAARLGDYRGVG